MVATTKNDSVTPTANESKCWDLDCFRVLTPVEQTAIGSICLLAGPIALLENALVLGLIATSANLRRRPSYLFMGSLAMADIFASCFYTANFVDFHLFNHNDGQKAYLFKLGGVTMSFTGSVGSLLLTALDRFLCLHRASRYKVLLTQRRALLALLVLWSTTLLVSFLPLLGWNCKTRLSPPCSQLFPYISYGYLASWSSCILLVLGLILAAYALILLKAHRHQVFMSTLQGASGARQQDRMRMDLRLARTLSLILVIMVGCWLPVLCFMLADVSVVLSKAQKRAFAFCSTLCLVNSAVNPLLYALRCRALRVALLGRLGCLMGGQACCLRSAGTSPPDSEQSQAKDSREGVSPGSYDLTTLGVSQQEKTRGEPGGVSQQEKTREKPGGVSQQEKTREKPGGVSQQEKTRGEPGGVSQQEKTREKPGGVSQQEKTREKPGGVSQQEKTREKPGGVSQQEKTREKPGGVSQQEKTREKPGGVSQQEKTRGEPGGVSQQEKTRGEPDRKCGLI
ncbi:hypothetical protein NHX12_001184 [Muraenolepis orangiensis]|uniref:G-protein coupled receptors family 1 profile domain-containing protein n=1 Tax=Muraenolepis orangiensis TaxID=630683 RepID=A0A9Q0DZF2_9TELE|nr:hypothetical protein NHX12_001184 [Muraenolepis orangiensis]